MKKRELNYQIHNPNAAATAADYILKILMQANAQKARQAVLEAADKLSCEAAIWRTS